MPCLIIDGHVLTQSVSIMEYLEETRPEIPLMPKDPYQRSLVFASKNKTQKQKNKKTKTKTATIHQMKRSVP